MDTQPLIYSKIAAVMRDAQPIAKGRENRQQGFKFRGIDDVYAALHDILTAHEVFTVPEVLEHSSEERTTKSGSTLIYRVLKIRYRFYTSDGSFVDSTVIGEGMDSGDKASNKAMSVAHKYALIQVFAIPTEDAKDSDADSHAVQPRGDATRQPQGKLTPTPTGQPKATGKKPDRDAILKRIREHEKHYDSITQPGEHMALMGDTVNIQTDADSLTDEQLIAYGKALKAAIDRFESGGKAALGDKHGKQDNHRWKSGQRSRGAVHAERPGARQVPGSHVGEVDR